MTWEPGYDPTRDARMEKLTKQIFDVMASLPARSDNPRSETDIRRWATTIARSMPWSMPFHNGMTRAKQSVIRSEINNFKNAIEKAETILLGFHSDTFGKAVELGTSLWDIRASMQPAIDFAESMSKVSLDNIPKANKKFGKGANRRRAEAVATHCANYYHWITDKEPSRTFKEDSDIASDFVNFLEEIFTIAEIEASADGVAKDVIRAFKAKRTNWIKRRSNPSI
ncbi:hypothetical protein MKK75_10195 [Methylobacterium sp. J-030]|uniref:hypothetical protein n=1 Tax=Methylobacterium sp. J-030 TaxID=2836627 RepID=UPI001FBC0C6F|nr:hypothetical protein [Methylobacterium sp. J-030]MCJ2069169.1 hypothetical protein [Methylobacterium sp. J-030]